MVAMSMYPVAANANVADSSLATNQWETSLQITRSIIGWAEN